MSSAPAPRSGEPLEVRARDGVRLRGFVAHSAKTPRGTVVLLHGVGASSAYWSAEAHALAGAGVDVVAWDARGHGASEGLCTYGARERDDVSDVLDALARHGLAEPILLYGYSMGAAVAIQAAAHDPRVDGVLAVAPFASLDDVIRRVIWAVPRRLVDRAIAAAELQAGFVIRAVRPVDDAAHLHVPLVVVAGALDDRVPLRAARAVARAASAPLVVVPCATHDDVIVRCGGACDDALARLLREAARRRHARPR